MFESFLSELGLVNVWPTFYRKSRLCTWSATFSNERTWILSFLDRLKCTALIHLNNFCSLIDYQEYQGSISPIRSSTVGQVYFEPDWVTSSWILWPGREFNLTIDSFEPVLSGQTLRFPQTLLNFWGSVRREPSHCSCQWGPGGSLGTIWLQMIFRGRDWCFWIVRACLCQW